MICDPELAEITGANIDEDKYLLREKVKIFQKKNLKIIINISCFKMLELVDDFSLVSAVLLYDILNSAWYNESFNFDNSIQNIENSPDLVKIKLFYYFLLN